MGWKGAFALIGLVVFIALIATNPTREAFNEELAHELRTAIQSEMAATELSRALGAALGARINAQSIEEIASIERENYLLGSVFLVRPIGMANLFLAAADEEYAKLGGLLVCGAGGHFFACEERSRGILKRLGTRFTKSNSTEMYGANPVKTPPTPASAPLETTIRSWHCNELSSENPDPEWRVAFANDARLWNQYTNEFFYNRDHEEFVRLICEGNLSDAAGIVGRGTVSREDAQRISAILAIDTAEALSAPRPTWESRYALAMEKLGPTLCTACADNVAMHYAKTPESPCGDLATKAIEGDSGAKSQISAFPDFCVWKYQNAIR